MPHWCSEPRSLPAAAQTAGGVTLYGLIDTTIRYSTRENAAGNRNLQMTDGVLTGSRWGLRGTEDLGGGTKALFILESGFSPDTGSSQLGRASVRAHRGGWPGRRLRQAVPRPPIHAGA
ncbi:porin [Streptomyces sp. L7]